MRQLQSSMPTMGAGVEDLHTHLDLSWKESCRDPRNCGSRRSSRQPAFRHSVIKDAMWKHKPDDPFLLRDKRLAAEQCLGTVIVSDSSLSSLLWACSKNKDLLTGTRIHHDLQNRGLAEKTYSDALITMYAKCGELQKAQALLDMHSSSSIITWTALISSYARKRQGHNALKCFEEMQHEGITPDEVTYASILKACTVIGALDKGKQIHDEISRQGLLEKSGVLGNALVDMYAKCGAFAQAESVLKKLPFRNVVSWSSLISGYVQKGQGQQALECYVKMQHEDIFPDAVTYVCMLKACAAIGAIDKGKQIHDEISAQGLLEHNVVLCGALVDMYAKCGALHHAQNVLEKLPARNVVLWNSLIAGFAQKGQGQQALECFQQMQCENIPPNAVTYICILKSCGAIGAIDKGKQIHKDISRQGLLEHEIALGGALVDMYAKCGAFTEAQNALKELPSRDVVSWSALIAGYTQNAKGQQALDCFDQMQHEGIFPDAVTYLCVLKACAVMGAIDKGKQIHDEISRRGFLERDALLGNALVDMYAKCGALSQAQNVLKKLPCRSVVSWSALIAGYAQKGQGQKALDCYEEMQQEGITPDTTAYLCILKACAVDGAIEKGKQIHDEMSRQGLLEHDVLLGNALVDMYAKCGALSQAHSVFEKLHARNVISWSALITGYAQEGQGEQALECFEQMRHEGISPDMVTFLCLLNMCSHLGLVERAYELFNDIKARHDVELDLECFTCMVDLLGRAGHLSKAVEVIQEMPFSANSATWLCLLSACKKWIDVNVGIWAFEQAKKQGECNGAVYVLMANIYAAAGMPEKAEIIEAMRIKNKALRQVEHRYWTDSDSSMHVLFVCAVKQGPMPSD